MVYKVRSVKGGKSNVTKRMETTQAIVKQWERTQETGEVDRQVLEEFLTHIQAESRSLIVFCTKQQRNKVFTRLTPISCLRYALVFTFLYLFCDAIVCFD